MAECINGHSQRGNFSKKLWHKTVFQMRKMVVFGGWEDALFVQSSLNQPLPLDPSANETKFKASLNSAIWTFLLYGHKFENP